MINILLPMASKAQGFSEQDNQFPKPLYEILGKTMIERVLDNIETIKKEKRFIFIVSEFDCRKFHLDKTLKLLAGSASEVVVLQKETMGAACSALMAIDYIENDNPLLILNYDQLFDLTFDTILESISYADAGLATFKSVHPRWSYVRVSEEFHALETAEKNPISRHAIAGFYYFSRGSDFVRCAMSMIMKGASRNDRFYIAPAFNELILEGGVVAITEIPTDSYHTLYSQQKITEYESLLLRRQQQVESRA